MRKTLTRISRTSWDEIQTRLRQEITKRAESALYRVGFLARDAMLRKTPVASPSFFFSPSELPERVALIREHVPEALEQTIVEAEEIMQHRFQLLGYRDLDYGKEIDWHLDAVHDKRAPGKPWYKIRFLDFNEVGDHKVTWELNRHQHLVTLAKARIFTSDEKYVQEITNQFYSWQRANPYPIGVNWGSSLEVAFRSLSWLWLRALLASVMPASFDRDLLLGLARNGKYIEQYLSSYFSPNTHLIGEAVALFFMGTLCPEIPSAARWQRKGLAIVLNEAERQVRPDGVYFEQSLYYHVYALDFFLHTGALAARNNAAIPESFDGVLKKMLEVVQVLSRNGPPHGFGDDDGGRVFNPRRNRAEHLSDPLALGAAMFGDEKLQAAAMPTEEALWLFGTQAAYPRADIVRHEAVSKSFPDGGLYVMSSEDQQLVIDAGPQGAGRSGHGHADALSVSLSLNGQPWLIDSGSYVYTSSPSEAGARDRFRGTAAHNTLRVDGLDQAVPGGPFSWNSLPNVQTETWAAGRRFTLFAGSHDGYTRLSNPVTHRRMIFHLRGEYFLVRDLVEGTGTHELELFWHFAPGLQLSASRSTLRASSKDGNDIALLSAVQEGWDVSSEDGFVSPAYGDRTRVGVGRFPRTGSLPVEHGTLLIPLGAARQSGEFCLSAAERSSAYSYEGEQISDAIVFGKQGSSWHVGAFRSDAALLFARIENRELVAFIVYSGSFVEWNGQPLLKAERNNDWVEWNKAEGLSSSDPKLLKFFDEEALRSRTTVP